MDEITAKHIERLTFDSLAMRSLLVHFLADYARRSGSADDVLRKISESENDETKTEVQSAVRERFDRIISDALEKLSEKRA